VPQENIFRLEIAVEDLVAVRLIEGATHCVQNLKSPLCGERLPIKFSAQRLSVQQFHDNKRMLTLNTEVMYRDDVSMHQSRRGAGLLMKLCLDSRILREFRANDLDCNRSLERLIDSRIYRPHTTMADAPFQSVASG
jgi:hypothetical protein